MLAFWETSATLWSGKLANKFNINDAQEI
jgi:hypothetical protein